MKKKITVAMSGGVDSSVAAALLKEQGHEVEGVFMKNWSPDDLQSLTDCPWEQDQADAQAVCEHLGIPFRSINFEREYKERVVDYFLNEYAAGRTPNPDIMCNREIKFAAFLEAAEKTGAEAIATGHYARVEHGDGAPRLYRGLDPKKDQSYFLYMLNDRQLNMAVFPLAELTKAQVREKARELKLPNADKKDSQGICFIGHIDLKQFLQSQLGTKPGETYLLPPYAEGISFEERVQAAQPVGSHLGAIYYTVGERTGQAIDNGRYRRLRNNADVPATYLVKSDAKENRLYVSDSHDDPHLFVSTVYLDGCHLTGLEGGQTIVSTIDLLTESPGLQCQIRYQQTPVPVRRVYEDQGRLAVEVGEPLWAVAEGQSLVFYAKEQVIGGGVVCAIKH